MNPLLIPAGPVCLGLTSQQHGFRASTPASGQACSAGSSKHATTCTQPSSEIIQCRPSSDPLVAFHVTESQWTGQSQKQQENIKSVLISAKKTTMKRQPLLKSQSDCLLFGVEGFVLCNLWQEGEGTREKKGSEFLQLQFVAH